MADPSSRSGARYVDPRILAFVDRVHHPHDVGLSRAFDAPGQQNMPAIQVSPAEGGLLTLLIRLSAATKVVEIGTLAGYSAIRLARGLPPEGRLWTLELDPRHAQVARDNIDAAGVAHLVEVLVGPALESLAGLVEQGPFDVVFADADKENYPAYGRWAADNLRPGGLLIGDNSYLFGRLMDQTDSAAAMRAFHLQAVEAFDTACIPTPDGMLLGVRR